LEPWVQGKFYDRLGLGEERYTLLDVSLPIVTVPVRPGRNLAGIVEIATMKNRQMKYGYNAAQDFIDHFDSQVDAVSRKSKEQA
ncbi:MAG: HPr kinase/phosphorylase, partial [Oscillospiraceae bacterium]|nr:HPr kinase/phosphorylase [Oscillospiraceae bacterium]